MKKGQPMSNMDWPYFVAVTFIRRIDEYFKRVKLSHQLNQRRKKTNLANEIGPIFDNHGNRY
jgi:hypothetical protein